MKFSIIATAVALLAPAALAAPTKCLSKTQAQTILTRFTSIQEHVNSDLGTPQETGDQLLVENYQEISDSILSLLQQPLGGVTFQGRDAYLASVLNAPASTSINTIALYVVACNKFDADLEAVWQWQYDNVGTGQFPVKGFHVFTVNRKLQIVKTELEFNSIAWGIDIFQLPCGTPTSSTQPSGSAVPPAAPSAAPTS